MTAGTIDRMVERTHRRFTLNVHLAFRVKRTLINALGLKIQVSFNLAECWKFISVT